jgi:DNA-binding transcriptional ArsR family regulator
LHVMESNEVSLHRVRVFQFLKTARTWKTNEEVSKATGIARRTARSHTKALADLNILDQAEVFPAHRYRLSDHAEKRNKAYILRLRRAAEIFGLSDLEQSRR